MVVVVVGGICGAFSSHRISVKLGAKRALSAALVLWVVGLVLMALTAYKPEHENISFVFGFVFGFANGWTYPATNNMVGPFIPSGRESEYFGLFLFASSILAFAPPLLFSAIYEGTNSMRFAFPSAGAFQFTGLLMLQSVNVEEGIRQSARDDAAAIAAAPAVTTTAGASKKKSGRVHPEEQLAEPEPPSARAVTVDEGGKLTEDIPPETPLIPSELVA
jgi:MFS family permease